MCIYKHSLSSFNKYNIFIALYKSWLIRLSSPWHNLLLVFLKIHKLILLVIFFRNIQMKSISIDLPIGAHQRGRMNSKRRAAS